MNYSCLICNNTLNKPIFLQCKHYICQECISRCCNGNKLICPVCKQEYNNINVNELPIDTDLSEQCQEIAHCQYQNLNVSVSQQQELVRNTELTDKSTVFFSETFNQAQTEISNTPSLQNIQRIFQDQDLIDEYKQLSKELQSKLNHIQENDQDNNNHQQQMKENVLKVTEKINQHFEQLISLINTRKNDILNEVQSHFNNYLGQETQKVNTLNQIYEKFNKITKQENLEETNYEEKCQQLQDLSKQVENLTNQLITRVDCVFQQQIQQEIRTYGQLIVQKDIKSQLKQQQKLLGLPINYIYYDLQHDRDISNPQSANQLIQQCLTISNEQKQYNQLQYEHAIAQLYSLLNNDTKEKPQLTNQEQALYITGYLGTLFNTPQELFNTVYKQFNSITYSYQQQLKMCNAQINALRGLISSEQQNQQKHIATNQKIFQFPNHPISLLEYLSNVYGNVQKIIQQQLQKTQEQLSQIQRVYQLMAQQYYQKKQNVKQIYSKLHQYIQLQESDVSKLSASPTSTEKKEVDQNKAILSRINDKEKQIVMLQEEYNAELDSFLKFELTMRVELQNLIKQLLDVKKEQLKNNSIVNQIVCDGVQKYIFKLQKEVNSLQQYDFIQQQDDFIYHFELKILYNSLLDELTQTSQSQMMKQMIPLDLNTTQSNDFVSKYTTQKQISINKPSEDAPIDAIGLCIAKQDYTMINNRQEPIKLIKSNKYWIFEELQDKNILISSIEYPNIRFRVSSSLLQFDENAHNRYNFKQKQIVQQQHIGQQSVLIQNSNKNSNIELTQNIQKAGYLKVAKAKYTFATNEEVNLQVLKGDEVIIYNILEGNQWYKAKNVRTNAIGLIPVSYID